MVKAPLLGIPTTKNMFGFRGVDWHQKKARYRARIYVAKKARSLGYFVTAQDAAKKYDEAAREAFGASAVVNFPAEGEPSFMRSRWAEGFCAFGHDLRNNGYFFKKEARVATCRLCNASHVASYKRRKSKVLR